MNAPPIPFDEGWSVIETGITKLTRILEGEPEPRITFDQYMKQYTTINNMCTQRPPNDYSQQLYDKYKEAFVEYINSMVLPSLRKQHDEFMLQELVKRWSNHKVMVRWLSRLFIYLDRYFIRRRSLPSLNEVGLTCFRDSVYEETKGRAKDALIALINQEREGEQIDRALLNNVLGIYVEIGMGQMDCYERDFEAFMLADSADYCARKASNWIKEDSCLDYVLKAKDFLQQENDRVDHYLHPSSRPKLIEKVQNELLVNYSSQLFEFSNKQVDDLRWMYKFFSKIPKGLDPFAIMFKKHVTEKGMDLVQEADAAASDKVFVRKVIDLHDKFMAYVNDCFSSHTLFHKALKEAFEDFCNKTVDGCAKLLLAYCDNILKNGDSEKLSDEAIEETLDKVVKLLAYISDEDLFAEINSYIQKLSCDLLFNQVDDLTRMYKLFSKIPNGLDPFAIMFKQHVTDKGTDLIHDAAASNKSENLGDPQEQVFVRKVIDLHDKFMAYVNDCFSNDTLFHKALKEAFEVFCNETVDGCAKLLLTYCNNILKNGDNEKLSDEAIEETLDKVVQLLAYISDEDLFAEINSYIQNLSCDLLFNQVDDHTRMCKRRKLSRPLLFDQVDDLTRMYKLLSKIPKGLVPFAIMFKQHVTDKGTNLVRDAAASNKLENVGGPQEQVFVRKVIDLHDKFMAYVTDCFSNHPLFHKALKEAFEVFCNKTVAGCSCAELLSAYCDNILKKGGSEKLSDKAIEETLDKVVKLLAYISDKDLFANLYRKKFSRRLLFDKSANDDHERLILSKLKLLYGGQFTSKMERMVTDLALAKDTHSQFNEYLSNNPVATPGIDFTVTVLTTGFWPSYKSSDLCLPVEMVKCVEVFKEFYQTKTKHRKLTWIYSLGTCNVNGKFDQKTIELILGTYQAAALLLFNASEKLSYSEIKTQLNLADDDVVRLLHSLSCAKYKILTKVPSSRTVSETDVFQFNSMFTDRMRRIRIPMPHVDERKKVVEDVDKDRRYAIDASIVRIMKSRKVLNHQQLVSECVEQLGRMFKPDFKVIKKRIEDLITREYLERDKENPQQFRYLA